MYILLVFVYAYAILDFWCIYMLGVNMVVDAQAGSVSEM
jgi:hypothetical protein